MKPRLFLLAFLAVLGLGAATYTITQLTENATPGAGTIIEIYDPTHSPKSGKITLDSDGFRAAAGLAIGTDVLAPSVISDAAYDAATWNGSTDVPTKNAVRDKIEAIVAGGGLGTTDIDTSAEISTIVTDETGTGALVFAGGPTFTGTINGENAELSGNLGIDGSLYVSGLLPGHVYLDANTNLVNMDATAEAAFDALSTNTFTGTGTIPLSSVTDAKAPLAGPALTGDPTAPTPAENDNDTSIATTAYVQTEIAGISGGGSHQLLGYAGPTPTAAVPRYHMLLGVASGQATEANVPSPVQGGTYSNFYVQAYNIGAGTNAIVTLMTNGVASAVTCQGRSTGAAVYTFSDTTHSLTVADGDRITLKFETDSSAAWSTVVVAWSLKATLP